MNKKGNFNSIFSVYFAENGRENDVVHMVCKPLYFCDRKFHFKNK